MGRFPYPVQDDVQQRYYILNDQEVANARFLADQDVRERYADSVSEYQARIDGLITQINEWGHCAFRNINMTTPISSWVEKKNQQSTTSITQSCAKEEER